MPAFQREAAWAEARRLGDLRQSVPQNGRVHLHTIEQKTHKRNFLGIVPGFSGDLVYVFSPK